MKSGWTRVIKHDENWIAIYLALTIKEMNSKYDLQLTFEFTSLSICCFIRSILTEIWHRKEKKNACKLKSLIDWSYWKSEDKTLVCDHLNESYWALLSRGTVMLYKVVLAFKSVDEILICDHSNESYWVVLSCGSVYLLCEILLILWINPKCVTHSSMLSVIKRRRWLIISWY